MMAYTNCFAFGDPAYVIKENQDKNVFIITKSDIDIITMIDMDNMVYGFSVRELSKEIPINDISVVIGILDEIYGKYLCIWETSAVKCKLENILLPKKKKKD